MEIVIDKNIPVPKERPNFKSHIDEMEVGDSFRVDSEYWTSLRNAASNMNKRTDKRFVVNKVNEPVDLKKPDGKQGEFVRIWRKK
jgi:hypothetical protein